MERLPQGPARGASAVSLRLRLRPGSDRRPVGGAAEQRGEPVSRVLALQLCCDGPSHFSRWQLTCIRLIKLHVTDFPISRLRTPAPPCWRAPRFRLLGANLNGLLRQPCLGALGFPSTPPLPSCTPGPSRQGLPPGSQWGLSTVSVYHVISSELDSNPSSVRPAPFEKHISHLAVTSHEATCCDIYV